MSDFKYVIVGGGMTGHAAAEGIRSVDASGSIVMLGDEPDAPYVRPPLTKGLWSGQEEGSIRLPEVAGLELRSGTRVLAIDRAARRVALAGGETIGYERLLLATGGTPRRLAFGGDAVVYFRTVADFRRVRELPIGKHVAIVGGGFIGSELAASLATAGYRVTLVFPEEGIGARIFPRDLSVHLVGYYAERDVEVRAQERVDDVQKGEDGVFTVTTTKGVYRARAVILVGADKGLCGALNNNLFRVASQYDPASTVLSDGSSLGSPSKGLPCGLSP